MRKKFLGLLTLLLSFTLAACGSNKPSEGSKDDSSDSTPAVTTRYTVKFENNGERVATESVIEGEKLTAAQIPTVKTPDGKQFVGWADENDVVTDLTTYVVTRDVTFHTVFEDAEEEGALSVDDVKEEGKEYYLVLGWWEVADPNEPDKVTSHLTKQTVRLFYSNLINYLKAVGATDENIENIQFRNYASATVADMGAMINADADVDLMIGVGKNINTDAGVALYNSSNDYKFQTPMGEGPTPRYVACLSTASELGVATYDWLKNTDAGIASFVRELTDAEIEASLVPVDLDFTVTVHGDEVVSTTLHNKNDLVDMPTITIPDGKIFVGFATEEDGEVVLEVSKNAKLKYDDVIELAEEGAKSLDLYPVFEDAPVVEDDLVVYVQINSKKLPLYEAKLLEGRFNSTLKDEHVKFNFIEGDAATFTNAIGNDSDVIIGGNTPVDGYGKHDDGPTANAGARHFADGSRKVIISDKVSADHLELAKKLYDFVVADAIEYEFHYTYWVNADKWVTEEERNTMSAAIQKQAETYLGIKEGETLLEKYNVVVNNYVAKNTKVAQLCTETKELRDGKGTDLIIGCGGNVADEGNMTVVEFKPLGSPFVAAASRYVALVNENPLARNVYDTYFVASSGQ